MKTTLRLLVVLAVGAAIVFASKALAQNVAPSCVLVLGSTANSASTSTCRTDAGTTGLVPMWTAGATVAVQCPGISVYHDPRATSGATAGPGDFELDFTQNPDPVAVQLKPNQLDIALRAKSDAGTCVLGPAIPKTL